MPPSLTDEMRRRVLTLDGAMATMLRQASPGEADLRGSRFASRPGCYELLCLTRPDLVSDIHRAYIEAGADIVKTNSFSANAISLRPYGLEQHVGEINRRAALIARRAAGPDHWVAGSMGPSDAALSAASCGVGFETLARAFREQAFALIDGGVDLLLLETMFDLLNVRAAIAAIHDVRRTVGRDIPVIVSATLTQSGLLPSGHTLEEFIATVDDLTPLAIGLNCGFGPGSILPPLRRLSDCPYPVSVHSSAGLPDRTGRYPETPQSMAFVVKTMLDEQLVNIVGGCCGTTPEHIRLISQLSAAATPRPFRH